MKRIYIYLVILSILISCEDATEPQQEGTSEFLPLKIGNYWIYNSYEKDFANNIIYSTVKEDSLVIEKTETLTNRTAYYFVNYESGKPIDTMFFSYEDNIIYRLFDSNSIEIPSLPATWFPVADFKKSMNATWNIYKQLIDNYPYADDDGNYTAIFHHAINGEYMYLDSLVFNEIKYLTKSFTNKFDSKLDYKKLIKLSEKQYDTLFVSRLMKYYDYNQFLEGIGIFRLKRDSYVINTITDPSSTFEKTEYLKGYESLLKRYKLK